MKLIKEAYMQSTELDAFVSQVTGRFNPYFDVILATGGREMINHFATKAAAQEYYDSVKQNIKDNPDEYINPSLSLEQVNLDINTEELNYYIPGEEDEGDYSLYDTEPENDIDINDIED